MPREPLALLLSLLIIDIFSRWGYLSFYHCPWEAPQLTIPTQYSEKEAGILYSVSSMSCSIHVFSWEEKVCFLREKGRISIAKQSIEQNNTGRMWAFEKVICTKWPLNLALFEWLGRCLSATLTHTQSNVTNIPPPEDTGYWKHPLQLAVIMVYITLTEQCHFNHKNLHLYYIIGRLGTWIALFCADVTA